MTPSLSDSELSDAAEGQSPRGGPQSPSLRSRSQSLIHLSSTSPRILNPLRKLEKKLLQHEAERANERATVYETMPDSTNATHDPPYLAGQPRSEHINVMGAVGERHAPRPQTVVDVAGDLLAVASDVRVQIGSISTGISARKAFLLLKNPFLERRCSADTSCFAQFVRSAWTGCSRKCRLRYASRTMQSACASPTPLRILKVSRTCAHVTLSEMQPTLGGHAGRHLVRAGRVAIPRQTHPFAAFPRNRSTV